jgi:hypothetical protein
MGYRLIFQGKKMKNKKMRKKDLERSFLIYELFFLRIIFLLLFAYKVENIFLSKSSG